MSHEKTISFKELSQLIVIAIEEEQFFNKETLVPKVKAILSGFNMKILAANYKKIESPSEAARRTRALERAEVRCNWWKGRLKEKVGDLAPYWKLEEEYLKEKGF